MEFQDWEQIYELLLADFGYDRAADEAARDWLAERVERTDLASLPIDGAVAIAGAGPDLESETAAAREADAVIAASDAGTRLAEAGCQPELVVTDLDGDPEGTLALAREDEVPVAIHAHGDNREALERFVPEFPAELVFGTTQARPVGPLHNHGGFTDGDRAAFIADELGAESLAFPGWDFDAAGREKRAKLAWAERLLFWLEQRRGDHFDVLDGRRDGIDITEFPSP